MFKTNYTLYQWLINCCQSTVFVRKQFEIKNENFVRFLHMKPSTLSINHHQKTTRSDYKFQHRCTYLNVNLIQVRENEITLKCNKVKEKGGKEK